MCEVVNCAEKDHTSRDHNTVIHCHWCHGRRTREETEDDKNDHIANSKDVVHDAPRPWDVPRSPSQVLQTIDSVAIAHLAWRVDIAPEASPKKQAARDEVGSVECCEDQGDDILEGGG